MVNDAFSVSGIFRWNRQETPPEAVFERFASIGTKYLTFDAETTQVFYERSSFIRELHQKAGQFGLAFRDAHAPWGAGKDLNELASEEQLAAVEKIIAILGECGGRTLTFHIGTSCIYKTGDWAGREEYYRTIAAKALERLLKSAEKYNVILCVENCFEPSTTAEEAIALVKKFDSPFLGLCLDCGHANLMEPMADRDVTKMVNYIQRAWNMKGPAFTPGIAEMMLPDIVTVHVHDNNGLDDKHALPDENGTVPWGRINGVLKKAPRLLSLQSEVETADLDELAHIMHTLQNLWK